MAAFLHLAFFSTRGFFFFVVKTPTKGLRWIALGVFVLAPGVSCCCGVNTFGSLSRAYRIDPVCALAQFAVLIGLTEYLNPLAIWLPAQYNILNSFKIYASPNPRLFPQKCNRPRGVGADRVPAR